ncbi:TatD DNase [Mortierella sp. GBA30]|nr:TatD DNase [Mortierella sp. GBA30]
MFRGVYHGRRVHEDDFAQVMNRARNAGVNRMIITGCSLKDVRHALDIAKDDDYDRLFLCTKQTQMKYFEWQFELAEATGLPMFLHDRNTSGDFLKIITENRDRFTTGVVHSFTGTLKNLKHYLNLGFSMKIEENLFVTSQVPLDRLLLETDGPWCDIRASHASFKHLSKMTQEQQALYKPASKNKERFQFGSMVKGRNEPCTIGQVLLVLADLHQMDPEELAEICYQNTLRLFFPQEAAPDDGISSSD